MAKTASALETELRLGLPGGDRKRGFSDISSGCCGTEINSKASAVVGWPPVCAYRRKSIRYCDEVKMYVKVSMDGAPFLRKIDLTNHKDYSDLVAALEDLFACFGLGEALKDGENCEYVPIYEDKDGDWMLVGDVPWGMFVESCKRLRIKKRSDIINATGIDDGLHAKDFLKNLELGLGKEKY